MQLCLSENKRNAIQQEQRVLDADETLEIEQEALWREQAELLKQELQDERQRLEEYHQELLCANSEISVINKELQDLRRLEKLQIDEAKRVAQNILSSQKSTSESLAELLSAIYDVSVTAVQLEPIT